MYVKVIGWVVLVFGVILLTVSLLADLIGLGGMPGFGWRQSIGAATGGFMLLAGGGLVFKSAARKK
ncbi:MAG TPA: hypothetical protein VLL97_00345 [Acidobacteriota bacterium]|nr:hypothetical protein [Acidobacteriota bacterium]